MLAITWLVYHTSTGEQGSIHTCRAVRTAAGAEETWFTSLLRLCEFRWRMTWRSYIANVSDDTRIWETVYLFTVTNCRDSFSALHHSRQPEVYFSLISRFWLKLTGYSRQEESDMLYGKQWGTCVCERVCIIEVFQDTRWCSCLVRWNDRVMRKC